MRFSAGFIDLSRGAIVRIEGGERQFKPAGAEPVNSSVVYHVLCFLFGSMSLPCVSRTPLCRRPSVVVFHGNSSRIILPNFGIDGRQRWTTMNRPRRRNFLQEFPDPRETKHSLISGFDNLMENQLSAGMPLNAGHEVWKLR